MEPIYLYNWGSKEDVFNDFGISEKDLNGAEILLAAYEYEDYSGNAFVLLRKGDVFYEVNGSHCSCYGLEDQWEMTETLPAALQKRLEYDLKFCEKELDGLLKEMGF